MQFRHLLFLLHFNTCSRWHELTVRTCCFDRQWSLVLISGTPSPFNKSLGAGRPRHNHDQLVVDVSRRHNFEFESDSCWDLRSRQFVAIPARWRQPAASCSSASRPARSIAQSKSQRHRPSSGRLLAAQPHRVPLFINEPFRNWPDSE